ncbi:MAG: iron-containing alcohol dehydrogenase [Syntrophobacterales bacterium]|nr:iron-containing alcohol dehydrogenase [Syntrophobacterales bacterium]
MQNFIFYNPTRIIFGQGMITNIGNEVRQFGTRVLLVYGQGSIKKYGIYDQVISSLNDAKLATVEFPGVKSNPVLSHALKGIELARNEDVDVILAVGGGSVIDTAKTIAVGVKAGPDDDIWEFFTYKKKIRDALPVLTVVTISASASEMNPAAVITKEEDAQKFSIRSPLIQPKTSILDPTALFSLSPAYSAYSAVDMITHMLEGYFNNSEHDSPLQNRLVEGIMKTVMESTEVILNDPENYNARANIMWSATLAFNGLTTAGMGAISLPAHMIEHSLSALYNIAHGAGLGITLPGWMKYAVHKNPVKFARLGREIFAIEKTDDLTAGVEGIDRLKRWFSLIGSPTSLQEADIPGDDIDTIAENAAALARLWGLKDYTREVISEILHLC